MWLVWLQLAASVSGLAVSLYTLAEATRDYRLLLRLGIDGAARLVATQAVLDEAGRVAAQAVLATVAAVFLAYPNGRTPLGYNRMAVTAVAVLMASASVTAMVTRRQVLRALAQTP